MRLARFFTAVVAVVAAAPAAAVTVLLNDNFNAENGGNGAAVYSGFTNWTAADVDLLGPGYFFNLCQAAGGSTPCVDMEGNGNGSLTSRTAFAIAPGVVTIQFDLAGDQRSSSTKTVTARLVSTLGEVLFSEGFILPRDADFTTFTRNVVLTTATSARLSFASSGPADSFGLLLDNVVLTAGDVVASPVPEPSSFILLGGGFALVGAAVRRRRRR